MKTPKKHSMAETSFDIVFNNLVQLNVAITEIGPDYAPPTSDISASALQTKETVVLPTMISWKQASADEHSMQIDRYNGFHLIPELLIRIVSMMIAYNADAKLISDARSIIRNLRGLRKYEPISKTAPDAGSELAKILKRSVSQRSFVNRVGKLEMLVKILGKITGYNPNEADLKLPALDAFVASLNLLNKNEGMVYKKAQNARAARNKALFDPKTGVVVLGNRAKNYIKSAFGPASSQYAMVKHLIFEDLSKK